MLTKTKVILVSIALILSFAVGRWLAPTKVKTVIKTVTVESKTNNQTQNIQGHTKTTTTEDDKPNGEKIITTVITNDTSSQSSDKSSQQTSSSSETSKEISRSTSRFTISALAGAPISLGGAVAPIYGGQLYRDVLGPVGIGVWYLSNNTGGLSIGVSF